MADNGNADSVARIISASALANTQTSETIVVGDDIGGYKAGDIIESGTNVTDIINKLLSGAVPSVDVTIYYGALFEPPTSVEGLSAKSVKADVLVGDYQQHITAGDEQLKKAQYVCFAVPTGYNVVKWAVKDFPYNIPNTLVVHGGYNIYYLNNKSYDVDEGGIDYVITVELS